MGVSEEKIVLVKEFLEKKCRICGTYAHGAISLEKNWTAAELRKLPAARRNAILEAAAALAEETYRNDPGLTDFEAFGEEDMYGESTAVPEG